MPLVLRITLIFISLVFIFFVIKKVNSGKLQTQFSLIWLFISAAIIIIALFPQLVYFIANLLKIEASSNLVYLLGIVVILFLLVNITIRMSKQDNDIRIMVQNFGIEEFLRGNQDENNKS